MVLLVALLFFVVFSFFEYFVITFSLIHIFLTQPLTVTLTLAALASIGPIYCISFLQTLSIPYTLILFPLLSCSFCYGIVVVILVVVVSSYFLAESINHYS